MRLWKRSEPQLDAHSFRNWRNELQQSGEYPLKGPAFSIMSLLWKGSASAEPFTETGGGGFCSCVNPDSGKGSGAASAKAAAPLGAECVSPGRQPWVT